MSKSKIPFSSEKGSSSALLLIATIILIGVLVVTKSANQNVLGENESKVGEQSQEAAKKAEEQQKEASKKEAVGLKQETEIETPEGLKIKIKVEDDGVTKVEVEKGKLKLKYSTQNGKTQLEAEDEQGQKVKLKEDDLDSVKESLDGELEKEGIKISTASGRPVIAKNKVAAQTNFPLSIDAATNQLTVTTAAGQKTVTVLPDQAINNLLASGILSRVASQSAGIALTNDIGNLSNIVSLESKNNELVYKVLGDKNYKLLGLIPVSASTTAFVSAESGNLVAEDRSLLTDLIRLLSTK